MKNIIFITSLVLQILWPSVIMARRNHKEHHHYRPEYKDDTNVFREKSFLQDKEHIQEDIKEYFDEFNLSDDMTEDELEFYYFQIHDSDRNGYLDGLEILTALNHILDEPELLKKEDREEISADKVDDPVHMAMRMSKQKKWNEKFEMDSHLIDNILKETDLDGDGYVSYLEFAISRKEEKRRQDNKKN